VFDIQQGVCIGIFVKQPDSSRKCQIHYADLWGGREQKYVALERLDVKKTKWEKVQPDKPFHLFIPQDGDLRAEYERGWKITDAMPVNCLGVVTGQDEKTIAFAEKEADVLAKGHGLSSECVTQILYRPLDLRHVTYDQKVVTRPRMEVMRHMLGGSNFGLSTTRSVDVGNFSHVFCARSITGHHCVSLKEVNYLFPLYLEPEQSAPKGKSGLSKLTTMMLFDPPAEYMVRRPNFAPEFLKEIEKKVGKQTPEKIFNYIYAILHSPTYRTRYVDFLKIDFPRGPLTSDKKLFATLVKLGGELSALHLMESPELNKPTTAFPVAGNGEVEKGFPKFTVGGGGDPAPRSTSAATKESRPTDAATEKEQTGRVYINKTQYFDGVPPNVWNFTIGGYQVCEKWLKDRRERQLTHDDLQHYKKIVAALSRTIELMSQIDATIPVWPIQ
jgi:predicted helicase